MLPEKAEEGGNEYLYGEHEGVMTNLELEEKIAKGDERVLSPRSIVMIQCVGSRNEERNYCSRICCSHSIKNALRLKELRLDRPWNRSLPKDARSSPKGSGACLQRLWCMCRDMPLQCSFF